MPIDHPLGWPRPTGCTDRLVSRTTDTHLEGGSPRPQPQLPSPFGFRIGRPRTDDGSRCHLRPLTGAAETEA